MPQALFMAGYDVWFGCKGLSPDADTQDAACDSNVEDVGQEVIPTFVNFITQTRSFENAGTCDKVQIITHGYGAAEVLVTLSDFPTNSSSYISNVINLAPCAVATFLNEDADSKTNSKEHRMLANILDEEELLGDDQVLKEKESQGRRLGKNRNNYYERTKRFCDFYPSHCLSFCETWHS